VAKVGHGASQVSGGRDFGGVSGWTCEMKVSRGKEEVRRILQKGVTEEK
jgi:hypothetical protein